MPGLDSVFVGRDGSRRMVHGYRAASYDMPPGSAVGYMPELNVVCGIADASSESEQPLTKHLVVEIRAVAA